VDPDYDRELLLAARDFEDTPLWEAMRAEWVEMLDTATRECRDPRKSSRAIRVAQGVGIGIERATMVLKRIKERKGTRLEARVS